MPIITRSRFNASTPSATTAAPGSRSSTRRPSNSSLVPADTTKFHGFLEASYRSWRPMDTPHSFAMRNLNAGLVAAGGIPSTKVVYDALAEYAISQQRDAPVAAPVRVEKAVPAAAPKGRKGRSERNTNQLLWAQWVNWFEAFYEEAKDAQSSNWSNYAVEHWSRFVRREYNLSKEEVSEWLEQQSADRLLDSVGM